MKPKIEIKDETVVITINQLDATRLRDIAHHCVMGFYENVGTRTFAMQLRDGLNESIEVACSQRLINSQSGS